MIDLEGLVRVVVKNTEFRTIRKSKKKYIIQYPQQRVFNVIDWLYSTTDHEVQNISFNQKEIVAADHYFNFESLSNNKKMRAQIYNDLQLF